MYLNEVTHTYLEWIFRQIENHQTYIQGILQFSRSVMSNSLWPHEPQHTRPPYPSPTSGVYPNPCPLSRWCHPTISSSVVPFSSCTQSFPTSGSFQMSQLFASGSQVLEFQLQHQSFQWTPGLNCFRMDWLDLLAVQGTLKSLLQHHSSKASILQCSAFIVVQLSHPYMTIGKTISVPGTYLILVIIIWVRNWIRRGEAPCPRQLSTSVARRNRHYAT